MTLFYPSNSTDMFLVISSDHAIVFMSPDLVSGLSIQALTPPSPTNDGSDVLKASVDSSLVRELAMDRSPRRPESAAAVMDKCRMVIDDLQLELDSERARSAGLEAQIGILERELAGERKRFRDEREMVEKLRREKASVTAELENKVDTLVRELDGARDLLSAKSVELENMTTYCEKRVGELKKAVKDASSISATPPIPVPAVDETALGELKNQLQMSSAVIREKDAELRTVVESYEKQVRLLRGQLKANEELMERLAHTKPITPMTTPSPRLEMPPDLRTVHKRPVNPFSLYQ